MIRRIGNLLRLDWTNSVRDNIILYMIVGPLLLALGARLFVPSVDETHYTFAVQAGVDPVMRERLAAIGTLETYPDTAAVQARVLRSDDVPGFVLSEGQPALMFEGNEGESAAALRAVIEQALSGQAVATYSRTQAGESRSIMSEFMAIVFVMIATLLGALVMAFNLIEDKESNAIRALGVSPLSMAELTAARGLFAILLSLALTFGSAFILLDCQVNYGLLLVAFLFSMALPVLVGYVIGGLADNQLKAIAILKFFMLIYLTLPAIAFFLPRSWHPLFYILPNYWMWQTFEAVLVGSSGGLGLVGSGVITLVTSLALVAALLPLLRRQLKLR